MTKIEENLNNVRCQNNTHVPSSTNLARDENIEILAKFHDILKI